MDLVDKWAGSLLQQRIVAVSDDLARRLAKVHSPTQIEVVRNGIASSSPAKVRSVELADKHINIGIVGRLVPVKRIDLFLQTAARIVREQEGQRYKFWIIGDGPLRDNCMEQARSLGISRHVEFVGHVPSALPYMMALDVLIMCSDHEGTPMAVLEALSCQLPVVAHDVGGLREILDGGRCGRLVGKQIPSDYADAVYEVIQSRELREQYKRNGVKRLRDVYSAEENARSYVALYKRVLAELE